MKNTMKKTRQMIIGLAFVSILSVLPGCNEVLAQEKSAFLADTTAFPALSSGWEEDIFTAVFFVSGKESGYTEGEWKVSVEPPFPHTISGLNDSYIQTAIGLSYLQIDQTAGMSWFLRAAAQDNIDAIMFLAVIYATNQQLKNTVEAERWYRKAIELGNQEAETQLDAVLTGKPIKTSVTTLNSYYFSFSKL